MTNAYRYETNHESHIDLKRKSVAEVIQNHAVEHEKTTAI